MMSRKQIVLIVASTAVFIEALDIAIINLAIPLIQKSFTLTNDTAQWLQTLYVLVYGGLLIVAGKLADTTGRKKIFMIGAMLFLITSLGAGLSSSYVMLLFFRALQGCAAAFIMPSALSIITNTFPDQHERSKAIGVFSSFAAVGSGCGLSLGGIIASWAGWPWMFFINVPVILIVLVAGYRYIDRDTKNVKHEYPDVISALLLTFSIILLSYVVHDLVHAVEHPALFASLTLMMGVGITVFIIRSRKLKNPLVDFFIFKNKTTLTGNGVSILLGATFTGYLFIVSLVLQNNMNYSAAYAGLLLFPFSILSALTGKFLFPVLLKYWHITRIALAGMGLFVAGTAALYASLRLENNIFLLLLSATCITGLGIAVAFSGLMVMCIQHVPPAHHGLATSMMSTCYFLGGGLGLSAISVALQLDTDIRITTGPVVMLGLFGLTGIAVLVAQSRQVSVHTITAATEVSK